MSDWKAAVPAPYDGIRVAGTLWSPRSHHIKDFLWRNRIPYQWLNIEQDAEAAALVESTVRRATEEDTIRLPIAFFPDGTQLIDSDNRTLAEKVGLRTWAT